jgi:signal transduction histidine kinase
MKRFWPKSLFGQLMLVVALALFVAQAINFAMLVRAGERLRFAEAAGPLVARVVTAAERVEAGEPLRARRGGRRRGRLQVDIESAVEAEGLQRLTMFEERLASSLESEAFPVREIHVARADMSRLERIPHFRQRDDRRRPPEILRISIQLENDQWLNGWMRVRPPGAGALVSIVAQTVILYGVLLLVLFLFVRRVSRPLRSLTDAVHDFSNADRTEPIAVEGPRDVAGLIVAFNAMQVRIAAMLGEKDHMLGAIGHDLRTPLAALRIHTENVPDQAERARMVETITDMTETLDDILSLARLGKPNAQSEKLDLTALVESAIEDFRDVGAPVTFDDGERLVVSGRSNLLKRAIRNLIDNAVRYGDIASVRVRQDADQALIEIDDKGPGIDDEALETVFEPFTRLEESRNREQGGSGLGLALARAIVREHGGELTLENLADGGLRARLSLPLRHP